MTADPDALAPVRPPETVALTKAAPPAVDRLDIATQAAWERNIADQMARGKFPPRIEWKDADDQTRAAWRSVTQAAVDAWERSA